MVNRLELIPDVDTYIDYGNDVPHGTDPILICRAPTNWSNTEADIFLHWALDLTGILANAVINSAKLIITPSDKGGDCLIDVCPLQGAFDDNTTTDNEPSWGNSVNIVPLPITKGVPFEVDIKALVQSWVANPSAYFGIAIAVRRTDTGVEGFTSKSKEGSVVSGGFPKLVIEFNNVQPIGPAPERQLSAATRAHYEDIVKKHAGIKDNP